MNMYIKNIRNIFFRLFILLILFQLTRLFFYISNYETFKDNSLSDTLLMFFYGTRFDLSSIAFANLAIFVLWFVPGNFKFNRIYQTVVKVIFVAVNAILLLSNLIDVEYFKFTKKRSTIYILDTLGFGNVKADGARQIPTFIKEFWYIGVFWILLILILIFAYFKLKNIEIKTKYKLKNFFTELAIFVAVGAVAILFARGGFQLRPVTQMNTAEYFGTANSPLISNTAFSIFMSIDKINLKEKHFFDNIDDGKIVKIFTPIKKGEKDSVFNKKNVVIIILESFSKEYIGRMTGKKTYTPFLDSLIDKSLCFSNAYANGTQSIEAVPSVITSIPSLMETPFVTTSYSTDNFHSLTELLKNEGYETAFFHGGQRGTMGFDNFAKLTGCEHIFEMPEYPNKKDYDGNWGIFDEPFLQFFANTINEFKEPFFSYIFTLSSHHPFTIPKQHKGEFADGKIPMQKAISYADYSLKQFFKTASKMSWYKNTLFVLVADHTGPVANNDYKNPVGKFSIPIIFYCPTDSSMTGYNDSTVTQQIDIMPSVLDYLDYDKNYFAFGNSVFNSNYEKYCVNYLSGTYQIIYKNFILFFDGEKAKGLFNFKNDRHLKKDLSKSKIELKSKMENQIKIFIQNYNNRLINNKLIPQKKT